VRAEVGDVMRWCAQDEMNQEDSEQDEVHSFNIASFYFTEHRLYTKQHD